MKTSNIEKIINSFVYNLKNINDLNCFIYIDSSVDISSIIKCRNTTLITSTDIAPNFIVQFYENNAWWDLISNSDEYNILKRYIKITLPNTSTIKYLLIDEYDPITGYVTLVEAFGVDIPINSEFEIVVLDSIFIKDEGYQDAGNQVRFNRKFVRLYMDIKTKNDSTRSKNRLFQELISSAVGKYNNFAILDDDLITKLGYMRFLDNGSYNETVDSSIQLISYVGSIPLNYYVDNFGV